WRDTAAGRPQDPATGGQGSRRLRFGRSLHSRGERVHVRSPHAGTNRWQAGFYRTHPRAAQINSARWGTALYADEYGRGRRRAFTLSLRWRAFHSDSPEIARSVSIG